jgi:hypothetical protein
MQPYTLRVDRRPGCGVTRRRLIGWGLGGVVGASGCEPGSPEVLAKMKAMAEKGDFAITGARLAVGPTGTLIPEGMTMAGLNAGRLVLPDPPHWLSLAPDGAWAAWVPESSRPTPFGTGGTPLFHFTDDPGSIRTVKFIGRSAEQLALSSRAEHLALVTLGGADFERRLIVLELPSGEMEYDVTDLISRFRLVNLESLRLSASGTRLAAGSRESFSVVDLPSRSVLFEGSGRFPRLSPSGEAVAFVGVNRKLTVATLATGSTRTLMPRWETRGVGSWSPDGRFLFAGAQGPLHWSWYLVAIDSSTGEHAEIAYLEEWNPGHDCALIKRRLLSPDAPSVRVGK